MMMMIMPRMTLMGLLTSGHRYRHLAQLWWVQGVQTARVTLLAHVVQLLSFEWFDSSIGAHPIGGTSRMTVPGNSTVLRADFDDRSLIMSCMCLYSLTPIMGSFTEYFLKYSSHVLLIFYVKARYPCTVDDIIASKNHGTCIGQWYFIS